MHRRVFSGNGQGLSYQLLLHRRPRAIAASQPAASCWRGCLVAVPLAGVIVHKRGGRLLRRPVAHSHSGVYIWPLPPCGTNLIISVPLATGIAISQAGGGDHEMQGIVERVTFQNAENAHDLGHSPLSQAGSTLAGVFGACALTDVWSTETPCLNCQCTIDCCRAQADAKLIETNVEKPLEQKVRVARHHKAILAWTLGG